MRRCIHLGGPCNAVLCRRRHAAYGRLPLAQPLKGSCASRELPPPGTLPVSCSVRGLPRGRSAWLVSQSRCIWPSGRGLRSSSRESCGWSCPRESSRMAFIRELHCARHLCGSRCAWLLSRESRCAWRFSWEPFDACSLRELCRVAFVLGAAVSGLAQQSCAAQHLRSHGAVPGALSWKLRRSACRRRRSACPCHRESRCAAFPRAVRRDVSSGVVSRGAFLGAGPGGLAVGCCAASQFLEPFGVTLPWELCRVALFQGPRRAAVSRGPFHVALLWKLSHGALPWSRPRREPSSEVVREPALPSFD